MKPPAAPHPRRASNGSRRPHLQLALVAGLLLIGGCTWKSWAPRERPPALPANAPRNLTTLTLDEPLEAILDCAQRECNHWYRVEVPHAGSLELTVDTHEGPDRPLMRVLVRELGQPPVAQTMGDEHGDLRLEAAVGPGLYLVLVQGTGGELRYTLTVALRS